MTVYTKLLTRRSGPPPRLQIQELASWSFVERTENIVLFGSSGVALALRGYEKRAYSF